MRKARLTQAIRRSLRAADRDRLASVTPAT
jgi:hypothetical protein